MNKTYPNSLRQYRQKAGLRQLDVSRILGVECMDRLSRWEHGLSVPSIINLFRLSVLYKVPVQELYPEMLQSIEKEAQQMAEQRMVVPVSESVQ